jgi:hypothetical protein
MAPGQAERAGEDELRSTDDIDGGVRWLTAKNRALECKRYKENGRSNREARWRCNKFCVGSRSCRLATSLPTNGKKMWRALCRRQAGTIRAVGKAWARSLKHFPFLLFWSQFNLVGEISKIGHSLDTIFLKSASSQFLESPHVLSSEASTSSEK